MDDPNLIKTLHRAMKRLRPTEKDEKIKTLHQQELAIPLEQKKHAVKSGAW